MRTQQFAMSWTCLLGIGLAASLGFAAQLQAQDSPKPKDKKPTDPLFPFTISKDTTRVLGPVRENGRIDFTAVFNARAKKNAITAENNAAVFLMPALGSKGIPEAKRERYFQTLGIPVPESPEGLMKNLVQVADQEFKNNPADKPENQKLFDQQGEAMKQPWSRKDQPVIEAWVDANAGLLTAAVEASKKPHFFLPVMTAEEQQQSLLAGTIFEMLGPMREVARLLTVRAMLAIHEGRIEDAQQDLLACHRLASLFGQQSTMIEALVSYALDSTASLGDAQLMQSPKMTAKQLKAYREELAKLPPLPKISRIIDEGERFMFIDAVCGLATQEFEGKELGLPNEKLFKRMMKLAIDWDLILKRGNTKYDEIVKSLSFKSYAARQTEIKKMEAELKELRKESQSPTQIALMFLGVNPPRQVVSQQMSNILLSLMLPAVEQANNAEFRSVVNRDLTLIGLALAEYQREHGTYPQTLNDLSPKQLMSLPKDGYTGNAYKYQKQDQGFVIYSQGPNGQDDKGQTRYDDPAGDDVRLQVPRKPKL